MKMNGFSFVPIELCSVTDKQAHYFVSCAERSGQHVVEVANKFYVLLINDYVYRAEDAVFQKVNSGTYIFRN